MYVVSNQLWFFILCIY